MKTFEEVLQWWQSKELRAKEDYEMVLDNFRILFACNSAAIEGNNLGYHSTREVFEGKITGFSGNVNDLLEMQNQKYAYGYILNAISNRRIIDKSFVKKLHYLLMRGLYDNVRWNKGERPGSFKKGDYCVGDGSVGSFPEDVDKDVSDLLEEVRTCDGKDVITVASYLHLRLEQIHAFAEGNGRVGRSLMNYFLMSHNYPPTVIFEEDKQTYYMALAVFDKTEDMRGFKTFLKEQIVKTWSPRIK